MVLTKNLCNSLAYCKQGLCVQVALLQSSGLAPMELAAALSHLSSHSSRLSFEASLRSMASATAPDTSGGSPVKSHRSLPARPTTAAPVSQGATTHPSCLRTSGRPVTAPARSPRQPHAASPPPSSPAGRPRSGASLEGGGEEILQNAAASLESGGVPCFLPEASDSGPEFVFGVGSGSLQPVPELTELDSFPGVHLLQLHSVPEHRCAVHE